MQGLPPSAQLLGIGFYFVFCIVLGTLGGREVDKLVGTHNVFTLVGLSLGLVSALYGGVRQLMDVLDAINRRRTGGQ
jgi:F0F1-type ATP synthase assembly protein I